MVELFRGSSQEIVSETEQEQRSVESLCLFISLHVLFYGLPPYFWYDGFGNLKQDWGGGI